MQGEVEKRDEISVTTRNVGQGCWMCSVERLRGEGMRCHPRYMTPRLDTQNLSTLWWRFVDPDGPSLDRMSGTQLCARQIFQGEGAPIKKCKALCVQTRPMLQRVL